MLIKVLGPGCAKCRETETLVREVLAEAGLEATVEKVADFKEMAMVLAAGNPAKVKRQLELV